MSVFKISNLPMLQGHRQAHEHVYKAPLSALPPSLFVLFLKTAACWHQKTSQIVRHKRKLKPRAAMHRESLS